MRRSTGGSPEYSTVLSNLTAISIVPPSPCAPYAGEAETDATDGGIEST